MKQTNTTLLFEASIFSQLDELFDQIKGRDHDFSD